MNWIGLDGIGLDGTGLDCCQETHSGPGSADSLLCGFVTAPLWLHGYSTGNCKLQEFAAWNHYGDMGSGFWRPARWQVGNQKGESRGRGGR